MRRDAIYYQIFKRFPSLLFTLLDHPPEQAQGYRFESIEVKEPDFRIDGVFLPPDNASPKIVYFAEFQAQHDELLYHRFFSESMLYLHRNPEICDDWFGVVIFTSRSIEPRNTHLHRSLLNSPQVRRIYLNELGDSDQQPIGISLLQLTTVSERKMATQAKQLLARIEQEDVGLLSKNAIIEVVTTIAVYKFTNLSRAEVEAMLGITLEETRFYQDVKEEGRLEGEQQGRLEGERGLILRQLTRHLQQPQLPDTVVAQVQQLSLEQVEALGEALFEFQSLADLEAWLQSPS
jgi:predicted transposase/invertase (TIGR01784 family)